MKILIQLLVLFLVLAALMVKRVHPEGDHVTLYVIAPVPSLQFTFTGGEEGQWGRNNAEGSEPWWISGTYFIILEW